MGLAEILSDLIENNKPNRDFIILQERGIKMRLRKSFIQPICIAVACAFGVVGVANMAVAEEKKAQKAAAKGGEKRAWIKICDDVKIKDVKKANDKKAEKDAEAKPKKICMTHHESLSARTGTPLVSAAIRNVEGHKTERFLVTVPLGMAIAAGVHVKVDEGKPIKFPYSFCHVAGCVAEINMTPELLKSLKSGEKLVVATLAISGKPVGFPIPLSGFDKAYSGKAIDGQKYANARRKMMMEIRKRQVELAKKAQEAQKKNAEKTEKK